MLDDYLDQPVIGADAIGRVARFVDAKGRVDRNKVYHALLNGHLDANKLGGFGFRRRGAS